MATLEQERHAEFVGGTTQIFRITSTLTAATTPAQLPHLSVFVLKIATRLDPDDDTLARVATVADLTSLPIGRDAGLATGTGVNLEFLSPTVSLTYGTLTEGTAAATAIKDRVDALIQSWVSYYADFVAADPSPASYTLPTGDESQLEVLITTYRAAKQSRYQKVLDKDAADLALTVAEDDYTYKQGLVTDLDVVTPGVSGNTLEMGLTQDYLTALLNAGTTAVAAGAVFLAAASCATAPDQSTFQTSMTALQTALNTATVNNTLLGVYETNAGILQAAFTTYRTARVSGVTASAAALTAAQLAQITKEQLWSSALATEATALAAVLVVCPDFDKNSIAFVDDDEP